MPATLFLVATPIGNLEDLTFRAVRILQSVSLIAAEDTRRTAILLEHYAIRTATTSFHEHNERQKLPVLLERLRLGDSIALVTDAGTPGVSDPGYRLARAAAAAGVRVEALPGASAVLAALVTSGLPSDSFTFLGFPPPKAHARQEWFRRVANEPRTLVFFEAPHRIRPSLEDARAVLGDREVAVCRELTKLHEEVVRGRLSSIIGQITECRGEMTVVVGPPAVSDTVELPSDAALLADYLSLTGQSGLSRRDAITELAGRLHMPSRAVYAAIERAKADRESSGS
jgi:16S rRNA (cytidine1402-2'-O)-methyltransferase